MRTSISLRSLLLSGVLLLCAGQWASAGGTAAGGTSHAFIAAKAEDVSAGLQTGTLLLSQGDCLAIRIYTASPFTHVAIVCVEEGGAFVYDSMNGVGVRRLSLTDYFAAESPHEVHVFHPRRSLTAEQGSRLQAYLQSQLGRPYAIHHHLTGERANGVHCAEYVTDALMSIDLLRAQRPSKVSPASLVTGITRADIYTSHGTVNLQPPDAPREPATNRCHQLWLDTKQCTRECCDKLSAWILCR